MTNFVRSSFIAETFRGGSRCVQVNDSFSCKFYDDMNPYYAEPCFEKSVDSD